VAVWRPSRYLMLFRSDGHIALFTEEQTPATKIRICDHY
jgi:hypothetical protein